MKLPRFGMVHALLATLVVGAAYAAYQGASSSPATAQTGPDASGAAATPGPRGTTPASPHGDGSPHGDMGAMGAPHGAPANGASPEGQTVEGDVLEVLDVPQYTYARLGTKGSEGTWTAFVSTKIAVGQHLRLRGATQMNDFTSKVLNRTFATIWFGEVDDGKVVAENPHAGMAGAAVGEEPIKKVPAVMHPVDRAEGPDGHTVAEIFAGRTGLSGKKVRVRGIVVKKTTGVLGHDYLHLRDGSGDDATHTNDLTVVFDGPSELGDTVLVEGTLALDVNIGSGYVFETLLQDAKLVTP